MSAHVVHGAWHEAFLETELCWHGAQDAAQAERLAQGGHGCAQWAPPVQVGPALLVREVRRLHLCQGGGIGHGVPWPAKEQ
eukprot:8592113-Lingulodinium_polyedra.AAC.1